jgi:pimeloyl-ACP methyl ester carboxylesterase
MQVNGVDLGVETFGDSGDPAVLLVGQGMLTWDEEFCGRLAGGGRYVVRYDPRDTGRSVSYPQGAPGYTLRDLVEDAAGVLDAVGVERAHVVGFSVGGWVAQLLALDHPERVATLTLIAARPTAPGPADADLPDHAPEIMAGLAARPQPDWTDHDSVVEHLTGIARLTSGSRGFDKRDVRAASGSVFDRARPTAKAQRASHLGSMFAALDCRPRWRERLGGITAPTLVVHGDEDPFFPHGNGVALAAEIPGATLLTLPGIGQGLPRVTWPTVVDALLRHTS